MLLITFAETNNRCVYCGNPGTSRDHFIPLRHEEPGFRALNFEVPCCHNCNSVAGTRHFVKFLGGDDSKIAFMFNRVRARADIKALNEIAPKVAKAYDDFMNNRLDTTGREGLCVVCGAQIGAVRIQQYDWSKVPHNERTCRNQHTKFRTYDEKRRRTHAYNRDRRANSAFEDLLADFNKDNDVKVGDLWRK